MRFYAVAAAAIAASSQLVAAIPPACLLSALGQQPDPNDFKAICVSKQKEVQSILKGACQGDSLDEAKRYYADTCKEKGFTVSTSSASPSSSGSDASSTATDGPSATSSDGTDAGTSTSASGSATPTAAGANNSPQLFTIAALLATGMTGIIFL